MNPGRVNAVSLWLVCSAWATVSGWALSALRQLHGPGWCGAAVVLAAMVAHGARRGGWLREDAPGAVSRVLRWRRAGRRFTRLLPACYAGVVGLSLLGAALHAPNNYDALTYRLPRMLHWLAEQRWHWIPSGVDRMNYPGVGLEWMQTPLFLLTGGDRWLFLLNLLPFLLLPGLLFQVFRAFGAGGRVAHFWMWFLPVSYGYALQVGGIGNDLVSVIYLLAALRFAMHHRRSGRDTDLWLASLATALLTGVKASNLPLAFPVAVALWPARARCWRRPVATAAVAVLCGAVSFLPIAVANHRHTGHWTGDPHNLTRMRLTNPVAGVVGNTLELAAQSLAPPVLPAARQLEASPLAALPESFLGWLRSEFPRFSLRLGELPQEEGAGVGLGCGILLLALLAHALRSVAQVGTVLRRAGSQSWLAPGVALAGLVATLAFMAQLGSEAVARLLQPYLPLWVLALVLAPGAAGLLRRRWWRAVAAGSAVSTLLVLVLTPSRPLFPASAWLTRAAAARPGNAQLERARQVFAVYDARNDVLAPLRAHLPPAAREIGYVAGTDDAEYALWRPFGTRRVRHLSVGVRFDAQTRPPMEWVVVKQEAWERVAGLAFEEWLARHGGQRVAGERIVSKVSAGPETWWVARFPPSPR